MKSKLHSHLKKWWLVSSLFLLILLVKNPCLAQERALTGTVKSSEDGVTLIGVSVKIKGTNKGTSTDQDGRFSMEVPKNAVLELTYIGFAKKEVNVGDETKLSLQLDPDNSRLSEVVVVGYGTQKRANLTGAVATISAKDLKTAPTANVGTLLYGKLPGLSVVQRSGEPGADDADIRVRGNTGGALIVVDGIPGRDFSRLNPNEIESVTVLKDAASAAVYGVSGGNGVILVTTKKGIVGKPELNYNINFGLQHVTDYPDFVNSSQFAELKNEASINAGGPIVYTPDEIEKFRNGLDPVNYPNVDYYNLFVKDYTPQLQQDVTVRGGSESVKYFFLLGSTKQASMWKGDGQDYGLYNFRSNVDAKINKDLDISVQLGGRMEDKNNLAQDSYLMASWMQYQWPIYNPRTPDGKIASTNYGLSAFLDPDLTGYVKSKTNVFRGNLSINYKVPFISGLSANITAAKDLAFTNRKEWRKEYDMYTWNGATQTSTKTSSRETNSLLLEDNNSSIMRIQSSLKYARSFLNKHNVSALLLFEQSTGDGYNFNATRINYTVPIDQIFAGPDLGKSNGGGAFEDGRENLVGRFNYDYMGKYMFEYSFGYNGSPKFPVDKRWGYFSSYSAGWRISEENFFKEKLGFINNLKLRGSWGTTGSDNTGNFQFLAGYTYPSNSYILGNNVVSNGLIDSGTPNPYITWENIQSINFGLDLGIWKSMFEMELDVFDKKRDGILATRQVQLPSTYGALLPAENLNSDQVRGFELTLRHNNKIGEVSYSISPNISFAKSKWDHVEQRQFVSQYDNWRNNVEGRFKGMRFGLKAIGQFQSVEEIKSSPIQDAKANSTLRPGDIKYHDFNKDGVIDGNDNEIVGRSDYPEINYGLNLNANWKKFSLGMSWSGSSNFNVEQQLYLISPFNNDMSAYAYFMDRWHQADLTDPNSQWIPGKYPSTLNGGAPNNNQFSSFWYPNATYFRLKSLNITYIIDNEWIKRCGVKNIAVTLSGQNLLTFSSLEFMDPESPSGRLSYYPQQKTISAGLNVTF